MMSDAIPVDMLDWNRAHSMERARREPDCSSRYSLRHGSWESVEGYPQNRTIALITRRHQPSEITLPWQLLTGSMLYVM